MTAAAYAWKERGGVGDGDGDRDVSSTQVASLWSRITILEEKVGVCWY